MMFLINGMYDCCDKSGKVYCCGVFGIQSFCHNFAFACLFLVAETMVDQPSTLSIDHAEDDNTTSTDMDPPGPPLDERIINIVKTTPDRTIRPARLAAALGVSVNDACAELCGLLRAVGAGQDGASFRFESVEGQHVMVFTFPPDFERRARRKRSQETLRNIISSGALVAIKLLKVVTALGLILSLLILSVAAMMALVAALVALSRAGHQGGGHRNNLMRQLRILCFNMRELMWCYAVFGPTGTREGQDPFMREIAYDMALVSSVCCGNPGNIFFWMRAHQLGRRRRRAYQGWSGNRIDTDVEGVTLIRRGTWSHEEEEDEREGSSESGAERHRGLLSVAVEFLFGTTPFYPGPSESDRWKLRADVLVQLASANGAEGLPLDELAPYVDSPPASLDDSASIIAQGLMVVMHFNGTPTNGQDDESATKSRFLFPELMAESSVVGRYEAPLDDDDTWASLLYAKESDLSPRPKSLDTPPTLKEAYYKFTTLSLHQLVHCTLLGCLNLIGVLWLGQVISKGGILEVQDSNPLAGFLRKGLMPILRFYAVLFFGLPGGRLLLILVLNYIRRKRNLRRENLARVLKSR
jgi:hypothetical protein